MIINQLKAMFYFFVYIHENCLYCFHLLQIILAQRYISLSHENIKFCDVFETFRNWAKMSQILSLLIFLVQLVLTLSKHDVIYVKFSNF